MLRIATATRRLLSAVSGRVGTRWGDWVSPALILLIPLVSFLRFRDFPLLNSGAVFAMAALVALGLTASTVIAIRPSVFRPVVLAVLAIYFFDVQFDVSEGVRILSSRFLGEFGDWIWIAVATVLGIVIASIAAAAIAREKLTRVLAAVCLTMFGAALVLPQDSNSLTVRELSSLSPAAQGKSFGDAGASNVLPPILHIVLDEHIGPAGIPDEVPGAEDLRRSLRAFFVGNGFRLYGRAFSHYNMTTDSLSYMFNRTIGPERHRFVTETEGGFSLLENAWFEKLERLGYRFRIYQTDHLNFCETEAFSTEYCATYPMFGLHAFSQAEIPAPAKVRGIFQGFLSNSFFYRLVGLSALQRRGSGHQPIVQAAAPSWGWSWKQPSFAPLSAPETVRHLLDDMRVVQPGTMYLVHLLLPHRGFVLDGDCEMEPEPDHWYDHPSASLPGGLRITAVSRIRRYEAYFDQVACSQNLVGDILASLDRSEFANDAMVIVQGDHGSRISGRSIASEQAAALTDDDLRDTFSTLFAIRAPRLSPGHTDDVRSIQALFAELVMGEPLLEEAPVVFLTRSDKTGTIPHAFRALDRSDSAPVDRPRN